jgi:hypothetical protein
MEMERRALEDGGYDSDLDREEAVMQGLEPREPEVPPDVNLVCGEGELGGKGFGLQGRVDGCRYDGARRAAQS